MDKRRFINQLPEINRTEPLKKFFGSTVDHMFQPGKPEQLSGYIGQKPSYYDPLTEFYIPEPSVIRSEHQLEPIMYSNPSEGEKRILFYEDFINYLRSNSGNVADHNRLFSDQIYSYAPPIDFDKLNNFREYYWFGDNPNILPRLRLAPSYTTTIADGMQSVFAIPDAVAGIPADRETIMLFVDGLLVDSEVVNGYASPAVVPPAEAEIRVYRYGNLKFMLEGMENCDVSAFNSQGVTKLSSNMRVFLDDALWYFHSYDFYPFDQQLRKEFIGRYSLPAYERFGWDLGIREMAWDIDKKYPEYWVEGVGTKIMLVEYEVKPFHEDAKQPIHALSDRRSRDRNQWTRLNYWVHHDSFAWSDQKFPERRASRPIIEFVPNIELFRYGINRLPDVTCTLTGEPNYCSVVLNRERGVRVGREASPPPGVTLANIPLADASGKEIGTVFVDADYPVGPGDRILVLENPNGTLKNCILTAVLLKDTKTLVMEVTTIPKEGDIVALNPHGYVPYDEVLTRYNDDREIARDPIEAARRFVFGHDVYPFDFDDGIIEYFFTGTIWRLADRRDQVFYKVPHYRIYNCCQMRRKVHPHRVKDTGMIYGGCAIFMFSDGPTWDPIVQRFLLHDAKGEIVFENSLVTWAREPTYDFFRIIGERAGELPEPPKYNGANGDPDNYYGDANRDPNLYDKFFTSYGLANHYTTQTLQNGVYSVPSQLRANGDNDCISYITGPQLREHTTQIIEHQQNFVGSPNATNNYRDTKKDINLGRTLIQHRSPMLKAMLLASDKRFDLFDSIRFIDKEYVLFRNKFVSMISELLRTGDRLVTDGADLWVDTVLNRMTIAKTPDFPFSLSQMIPGAFIPPTAAFMGILPCYEPEIQVDTSFSTDVTMIRGHDGSRTPAFGDIRDDILLVLEKRIYANIPAVFRMVDDAFEYAFDWWNYVNGAYRPALTDDGNPRQKTSACAASLPPNNASVDSDGSASSDFSVAKRRYTREEIVDIYTPTFMRWAQVNGLDFRVNDGYQEADPFTWNYRGVSDKFGNLMPGHWRAIYRWYFDTDRPHQVPWEMLGFSTKPSWWEAEYGPAPYTRGNAGIWSDISMGIIRNGARAGIDERFVRPNLLSILPVDDDGALLDPVAAGIVLHTPSIDDAKRSWKVGDHGPVENLWLNSSSWPFAKAMIAGLIRPAEFTELCWSKIDVSDNGQVLPRDGRRVGISRNLDRTEIRDPWIAAIHGELVNGSVVSKPGIQQWVAEYLISNARSPSELGEAFRGLEVRLAHKMAGFTNPKNLRVFADNFGIIPDEDIEVLYHESPPLREATYSGVIIEWTGQGYRVVGYDGSKEFFCTEPGEQNGPKSLISIGQDPVVYEWKSNVFYPMDRIVEHDDSTYRAIVSHTSSGTFEPEFWKAEPGVAKRFPRAFVTDVGTGTLEMVPYDTVFDSIQDVAEFLRSYSRWLEKCGWIFDAVDEDTSEVQDWNTATKTFMSWAQMKWQPGNFIALSPGASSLTFVSDHGMVYGLEDIHNGVYGLLDRTGRPIARRSTFVSRLDETSKIVTTTDNLFAARARVGEAEHVLIFSNLTIFNDVIYVPLFDLRQPRLRLLGMRSSDWNGRRDAPGYIVNGAELVPNFEKTTTDIREMFEIEHADNRDFREHARHVVGYQNRAYLDNLLLSETAQFEFYQGMIQQKGAPGVFNKLSRSDFIDQNRDLRFLEEWGLHVGRYGAIDKKTLVSFRVITADIRNNPQYVDFSSAHTNDGIIGFGRAGVGRWVEIPANPLNVFPTYGTPKVSAATMAAEKFLPTAGYVRRDEVDYSVFRPSDMTALYMSNKDINVGSRLWLYERRGDKSWDVLQGYPIGSSNNAVRFIDTVREDAVLLNTFRVTFTEPHNLLTSDVGLNVLINGDTHTSPNFEGFCELAEIDSPTSIIIVGTGKKGISYEESPGSVAVPSLAIFRSTRFTNVGQMTQFFTRFAPVLNQIVYVDDATPNNTGLQKRWGAYRFDGNIWAVYRAEPRKIETHRMSSALIFDLITKQTDMALTAEPLQMDKITVLDPPAGLISGAAEKELTFKVEYDPARYSVGLNDQWGLNEVGMLWWDLSAVRYLECQTDITDSTDAARNKAEISYRIANWTKLAPNTSVDIYEWTRATEAPADDNPDMAPGAQYVEKLEFDNNTSQMVTAYYYWQRNVATTPAGIPGRSISARQVSQLLTDPIGQNLPWVSPITVSGLVMGGIEQYLNDSTTVFQFEVAKDDYDGVVHNEWQLMLRADKTAVPPAQVWKKLQDSLVGFNEFRVRTPDQSVPLRRRIGLEMRPVQSMFDTSVLRAIGAGRRSFTGMVNILLGRSNIMFERPSAVSYLKSKTPTFEKLIWSMPQGSDLIEPPPVNSYDYATDSVEGLHEYFFELYGDYVNGFRPWDRYSWDTVAFDFDSSLRNNYNRRSPRVLLRNFNGPLKTWSVWEIDQSIADPGERFSPDKLLRIAANYDIKVADRAALTTLLTFEPPVEGTRILIESDSTAGGFWTTWFYRPSSNVADAQGLVIQNTQTYNVEDFWSITDWYAPGYSASKPPVVSYQTMVDRNNAEGTDPRNVFVRIANDGAGWAWTAFDGDHWVVVAREKGTIRLSDEFNNPARIPFARSTYINLYDASAAVRDGSWELRQIIHALRQFILTNEEINELFFSMIHFLHSAQDQVDWAFKTSFLVVRDFNERLGQPPIQTYDPTGNLLSYIEEVKPYHLKTRDFSRILTPDIDVAAVHVSDFDKPLYFDPDTQEYRTLRVSNAADALVLQNQQPWKNWYDNYLNASFDPSAENYNPVRRMNVSLLFDRVDPGLTPLEQGYGWDYPPMDIIPFDTLWNVTGYQSPSALSRMLAFYEPRLGMREKDIATLFNTNFKGLGVVGGELYEPHLPDLRDWDIRPYDTLPLETEIITDRDVDISGGLAEETQYNPYAIHRTAFGLVDPYHDRQHPEEFVPAHGNDHVAIRVKSDWVKGAPNQYTAYVRTSHIRSATVELSYQHVAQSLESVFVYRDGIRLRMDVDYTIDHFARTITVQMGAPRPKVIMAHILGSSGTSPIVEQRYFDCVGGSAFELFDAPVGAVEVLLDGVVLPDDAYTITGAQIVLDSAPDVGQQVTINSYGPPSGNETSVMTRTHQEELTYNVGQSWHLANRTILLGAGASLEHIGTIVEGNGVRLTPPFTRYGRFDFANNHRQLLIKPVSDLSNIQIWLDDQLYTGPIARGTSVADALQNNNLAPIVVVQDKLVQTNSSVNSSRVVVCIFEDHDYVVSGGVLTVTKQYAKSDFDVKPSGWDTYQYDIVIPPDDNTRIVSTTWENPALMGIQTHSFRGSGISEYFIPSKVASIDYLLVTKNGKCLTPGLEFSASPIDDRVLSNYDFDSGGWDSYDHDSFMFTESGGTLISVPGNQIASDKIVVMAFTGDPARLPNEWLAMTKQSGLGLMGDLAFSADWDVAPIDTFKLESTVPAVEMTEFGLRSVYKMNGTWDIIELSHQRTGTLVDDLTDDSDTITVHLNPYKVSNLLMPPQALPQPYDGSPGVIWINGERIEYFAIEQNNNTATLTELRRGTLATRVGEEQRNIAVYSSNGTTTEYPLQNADINGNIEVSVVDASGTTTALNFGLHFSASRNGPDLLITLNEAPAVGSKILLAQSAPATIHLAGSVVRHAVPSAYEQSPFMIKEDGSFWSEVVD